MGVYYKGYKGDTGSLDYSSYKGDMGRLCGYSPGPIPVFLSDSTDDKWRNPIPPNNQSLHPKALNS